MTEILFTGTGSGKRSLKREYSSFILLTAGYYLMIDCGDGISHAMLKQAVNQQAVDGILITHFHPDHVSGLPSLIVQMKMEKREKPLEIFADPALFSAVDNLLNSTYIFKSRLNFKLNYIALKPKHVVNAGADIKIRAEENTHLDDYRHSPEAAHHHLSSYSLLFETGGSNIFYTGDIGGKDDLYVFKESDIDVMISETSHAEVNDILIAAQQMNIPKTVLTHISDDAGSEIESLIKEKNLEDKVYSAYDGFRIGVGAGK